MTVTATHKTGTDAYGAPVIARRTSEGRVAMSLGALSFNAARDQTAVYLEVRGPIAVGEIDDLVADLQAMRDAAVAVDQQAAIDGQCSRIDDIEDWAASIDEEWSHHPAAAARAAIRDVETAWGNAIPGEDDGPVVLACYVRALHAAVDDVACTVADSLAADPRDPRHGAWPSALNVPAALGA